MNLDDSYTEFLTNQVAPPPAPPVPEPVAAPAPAPAPGEFTSDMSIGDYLGTVFRTLADIPDAAVRGAAQGLGEAAYAANLIDENQINSYRKFFTDMDKLRDVSGVNPTVSGMVEDVGQILPGALPAFKALRALPFMTRPVAAILAEGIGGAVGYNPDDPNLGNMISGMIGEDSQGPLAQAMQMLATNPEDPDIVNRARNFAQDAGLGGMFEGVFKAIQKSPDAGRAALQWFNDTARSAQQGTAFSGIPTRPDALTSARSINADYTFDDLAADVNNALPSNMLLSRSSMSASTYVELPSIKGLEIRFSDHADKHQGGGRIQLPVDNLERLSEKFGPNGIAEMLQGLDKHLHNKFSETFNRKIYDYADDKMSLDEAFQEHGHELLEDFNGAITKETQKYIDNFAPASAMPDAGLPQFMTSDGYRFYQQKDGTLTDHPDPEMSDMTFDSLQSIADDLGEMPLPVGRNEIAERSSKAFVDDFSSFMDDTPGNLPEDVKQQRALNVQSRRGSMQPVVRPEEQSRMVSARYPTAVKRDEDPVATQLNIGYEAVAADQKVLQRNTDVLRIYPGLRPNPSANAEEFAGEFIDDVKQNLIYLHNKVPEQTRQRSKLWYEGANKIANEFSTKYEVPDTSVAGVMAALSPQKDWFMNVSLAERTLDVLTNQRSFVFSDEMAGRMEQIFPGPKYAALREMMTGKTLDDLTDPVEKAFFVRIHDETYADRSHRIITPEGNFSDVVLTDKGEPSGTGWGSLVEISKAVRAYESGGDRSLMTEILGSKHKVRSFYNNIIEPNSANGDVTIDTHAVAAALLRPLSGQSREVHHNFGSSPMKVKQPENWQGAANSSKTGVQGTYGLYAEAYRQAAADLGILPRELQSITWEAVRGLFTDRFKSGKNNVSDINAIWSRYSSGELSIDEVRNAVEQRAGGIDAPSWQ